MEKLSFENHITRQFNDDLEAIRTKLMEMGGKVEHQLRLAVQAITEMDSAVAEQVIESDGKIDRMELVIDEACISLIARRQPAASDLRLIMGAIRVVNNLERIGDEAKAIGKLALRLAEQGPSPRGYTEVGHIGKAVTLMLHSALDAFARFDTAVAWKTFEEDRQVNLDYNIALNDLVVYMKEDPSKLNRIVSILWVIRSLERIGDHVKNVCEQVIYVVEGRDIRHGSA